MNRVKALLCDLLINGSYRLIVIALIVCRSFTANAQPPSPLLDLPSGKIKLKVLFDFIESHSDRRIEWDRGTLDTSLIIESPGKVSPDSAMSIILRRIGRTSFRTGNDIFIRPPASKKIPLSTPPPGVQMYLYTLRVSDKNGEPLKGATIIWGKTARMSLTDSQGEAIIQTEEKFLKIKITYVGMQDLIDILSKEGLTEEKLQYENNPLNEVIITGYGTGTKRTLTSNRTKIGEGQLNDVSDGTVQTVLEGQVAAVLVTATSGVWGSSVYLTVDGSISIMNGSDPLYIIDGVPYGPGNQSISNLTAGNSAGSESAFPLIPVSDIGKIEVLIDADATSIYGSRGAGGVIIITTKLAKAGHLSSHLQLSTGYGEATSRPPMMNTAQYVNMRMQAFRNDNQPMNINNAPDLLLWDTTRYTDWSRWIIGGLAPIIHTQASLSGGSHNNNYYFSANYLHQTNVYPGQPADDHLNAYANWNHQSSGGKLNIQTFGLLGGEWNHQFIGSDPAWLQALAPNAPPKNDLANKQGNLIFEADNPEYNNPLSFLRQTYSATLRNILLDASVTYRLIPSLVLTGNFGWNDVQSKEFGQYPISAQNISTSPLPTGTSYFATTRYSSWILEPQAEYKTTFRKLVVSLLGGATWQAQDNSINTLMAANITDDAQLRHPGPNAILVPAKQQTDYDYTAIFGRLNLDQSDKYIINQSVRRDGSNRFGPHERFGDFYAIGSAWVFTSEPFFSRNLPAISFGKLRASYGITGNDQIGDHYPSFAASTTATPFQNIPGFFSNSEVTTGQTWETVHKTSLALDLGLLNDRLFLTLTRYLTLSDHQLLPSVFPAAGPDIIFSNIKARLENKGWNIDLVTRIINNKDFDWNISFNASFPIDRLLAYPGLAQSPFAGNLIIGKSLTIVQGFQYLGVNKTTGIFQFSQLPGETNPTGADVKVVGQTGVTAFGGLGSTLRWKKFQFEILFSGRSQTGYNYEAGIYAHNAPGTIESGLYSNATKSLTKTWVTVGDNVPYQKLTTGMNSIPGQAIAYYTSSSAVLANPSFIRLKRVNFSYELPSKQLAKLHISEAIIYINTRNLFTLTHYKDVDPELQIAPVLSSLRIIETGIHLSI